MQIILASTSPRRIELLSKVGLTFLGFAPQIDETQKKNETPRNLVKRLSKEKAYSALNTKFISKKTSIVIAADTIVITKKNKVLGKPKNKKDAFKMLKLLSGKTHLVLTGICVLKVQNGNTKEISQVVQTHVRMRKLTSQVIHTYIRSGEPMDKAGSYAAQGLGMALVEEVKGSYSNVVGLPVAQLLKILESKFKIPFLSWLK